ncbi:MAG TPA: carboxypeptidase-like regulatory domain-containing protein, partial [Casimicrobiaceae bacterium]|nr:carboxypeptidase-like regulatory domain-containing protein [Casimicrobiaceae bacterium]
MITVLALNACGSPYYTSDSIEAWVVDADTGQPIEGAVVTANWQLVGFTLDTGGRKGAQLAVMETSTDSNGRFFFPGFTKLNLSLGELRDQDPQILAFKSGYRYIGGGNDYPMDASFPGPHRKSQVSG